MAEGSDSRLLTTNRFCFSERFFTRSSVPYISTATTPIESSLWRQLHRTTSPKLRHDNGHFSALSLSMNSTRRVYPSRQKSWWITTRQGFPRRTSKAKFSTPCEGYRRVKMGKEP